MMFGGSKFNQGRRHSSVDVKSYRNQCQQNDKSTFVTPLPSIPRRYSLTVLSTPVKKEKQKYRRFSIPELPLRDQSTIRKRLDFNIIDGSKKRLSPLLIALHSNDLSVPFSDLDVCTRSAKRVKFEDEASSSPMPETPVFNSRIRAKKEIKVGNFSSAYTKLSDPVGLQIDAKKLFSMDETSYTKTNLTATRRTARNLTELWN